MIVNEPAVVNQPLPGIDGGGVAPRGVQHRMLSGVPGQKPRVETPLQALVAMHLPETPFTLQSFAPAGAGTGFGVGFGTGGDGAKTKMKMKKSVSNINKNKKRNVNSVVLELDEVGQLGWR